MSWGIIRIPLPRITLGFRLNKLIIENIENLVDKTKEI